MGDVLNSCYFFIFYYLVTTSGSNSPVCLRSCLTPYILCLHNSVYSVYSSLIRDWFIFAISIITAFSSPHYVPVIACLSNCLFKGLWKCAHQEILLAVSRIKSFQVSWLCLFLFTFCLTGCPTAPSFKHVRVNREWSEDLNEESTYCINILMLFYAINNKIWRFYLKLSFICAGVAPCNLKNVTVLNVKWVKEWRTLRQAGKVVPIYQ